MAPQSYAIKAQKQKIKHAEGIQIAVIQIQHWCFEENKLFIY